MRASLIVLRAIVCIRTGVEMRRCSAPPNDTFSICRARSRRIQCRKPWITNDKAYSSWNVDAVVEHGAGADHDRDGCRLAGSVGALFALQGNRNRPLQ